MQNGDGTRRPVRKRRKVDRFSYDVIPSHVNGSSAAVSSSPAQNSLSHIRSIGEPISVPDSKDSSGKLKHFLQWAEAEGISIDPRLDLRFQGDDVSWSVSIHAKDEVPPDEAVVTIPKTAVLSRKTSALADVLADGWLSDSHETVGLELALCLLYERCLGKRSKFEPFLSILPRLPVQIPILRRSYDAGNQEDDGEGDMWMWLKGTEADRMDHRASESFERANVTQAWLYDHDYGMSKSKAEDYFINIGIPVLQQTSLFSAVQKQHLDGLLSAFLTAYTHVSSRDFLVDTYHGVGLVPVADLFNHTETHTIQFEADQDVCEYCGLAFLTGHTEEECPDRPDDSGLGRAESEDEASDKVAPTSLQEGSQHHVAEPSTPLIKMNGGESINMKATSDDDESDGTNDDNDEDEEDDEDIFGDDTLDMRTLTLHQPGDEMFNTYGPLSNAYLLTRYGFCLDTETDMERSTFDLRFSWERDQFFESFVRADRSSFESGEQVARTFHEVCDLLASGKSSEESQASDDEQETEYWRAYQDIDRSLLSEKEALDNLHALDSLFWPLLEDKPGALSEIICALCRPSPQVDEDLVDRDQVNPLFIDASGRISTVLVGFVYLIHARKASMSSDRSESQNPDALIESLRSRSSFSRGKEPIDAKVLDTELVRQTLSTLTSLLTLRLEQLYLAKRIDRAMDLLHANNSDVPYTAKACILHAYQEHAALKAGLGMLQDCAADLA